MHWKNINLFEWPGIRNRDAPFYEISECLRVSWAGNFTRFILSLHSNPNPLILYILWLNQNGHEFGRYLNFRYTPGVPGFRISSPSSRVDAKNAFDGYIHSMRSATEGSGDNKGLSEKMDSEEKEPWLKTDCPVIEGAVTGIPSASSFTCCKRGKHTPLFINQWEKDIYVFFFFVGGNLPHLFSLPSFIRLLGGFSDTFKDPSDGDCLIIYFWAWERTNGIKWEL